MLHLEVAGAGAGVVGTEAFDSLGFLMGVEKTSRGDIVVEIEVDDRGRYDGYEPDEHENAGQAIVSDVNEMGAMDTYICHS